MTWPCIIHLFTYLTKCFVFLQVGYPNVGKSSTINTLLEVKKVPVSATPGRTKHFQVCSANF